MEDIGSPLKKQRPSLTGKEERFGLGLAGVKADVLGTIEQEKMMNGNNVDPVAQDKFTFGGQLAAPEQEKAVKQEEMEEEL